MPKKFKLMEEFKEARTSVTVTLRVTVDTEAWKLTYGPQNVRVDVWDYITNQLRQSAAAEDCGLTVEVLVQS